MTKRDYTHLFAKLAEEYAQYSPRSAAVNEQAKEWQVDGGSHALRLIQPFPPRIVSAMGAWLKDEDNHDILDFWQGHFANILGHNPEALTSVMALTFEMNSGLQTGFADRLQVETAQILCRQTGAERARFTTSGTLATMYAIMLARAFTGRDLVMKIGGGWHGAQPWGLKGVQFHANGDDGFQRVETAGLPPALTDEVVVTRFNDPDVLRDHFRQYGDRLACFIVEPFIGAGGFIFATREYLQTARELTQQYGVTLIFDEVVSGFRFRAGDVGTLYDVRPDLATFGKIIGGGMPVSAVAGRADIMNLAGREGDGQVMFSGGTYSAHPASLLAGKTMMSYLVANEDKIYPRIAALGEKARQTVERAFAQSGIYARCTGYGNDVIPGSSISTLNFPYREGHPLDTPDDVCDPAVCDTTLSETVMQLALLLEDVHVMHGLGALSDAHTETDVEFLGEACRRVAQRIKPYL